MGVHDPPAHPGVSIYDTDHVRADHLTPIHDIFCPDAEYYPAEKAADITHPTIPQLDGSSVYSPILPPLYSLSGHGYQSWAWKRAGVNIIPIWPMNIGQIKDIF